MSVAKEDILVFTDKDFIVLKAVRFSPMTVDHYVTTRQVYVNSWAPTFSRLLKAGLLYRTGETRKTSHGSEAHVLAISEEGRQVLRENA